VHLVGFIIKKFVTMHGHTNVKKYVPILTNRVKLQIPLEISREICPPVGSTGKTLCVTNCLLSAGLWTFTKVCLGKWKIVLGVPAWTKCWETLT